MKKFVLYLSLFAILLSLCACGAEEAPAATTEPTETTAPEATEAPAVNTQQALTPEQMYGHINQMEPVNGVYQLWNAEGVKNIANHPDANFTLLCNIDMGGAVIAPIGTAEKPFTGEQKGANFKISNFTVQGDQADFGFVGVNKGTIRNLVLEDVTFIPGANAKNIGAMTGKNEGEIIRCTVGGTMTVETAAENAFCGSMAGTTTGEISNSISNVSITFTATTAATIGGIAGSAEGCNLEFVTVEGAVTIAGANKTTGLMLGAAKDCTLKTCVFTGADNSLEGQLFYNYYGTEENVSGQKLYWRDNSREAERPHVQEKREKAAQMMYDLCTIMWKPQNIAHTCNCTLNMCNGVYNDTYTHYGLPYNHKNGSLSRMQYCLNEDGTLKDWVYDMAAEGTFDTFDLYMGSDCSTQVLQAWLTVSNTVDYRRTSYQIPAVRELRNTGCYPVGEWQWDLGYDVTSADATISKNYTEANGPEVMYEAYAQLRLADAIVFYFETGHTRMIAEEPVVIRDENGKIDGQYSYVLCHEQGVTVLDEKNKTYSTCPTFKKYTFENLFAGYYLPVTNIEFITGEFDIPECTLEGGVSDSRLGLTTGIVKANYSLDYVSMVITDSQGNVVFDRWMFPTVAKRADNNSYDYQIRRVIMEYDLAGFAVPLRTVNFQPGETYHAVITGNLATGDSFVVNDFSFTHGNA